MPDPIRRLRHRSAPGAAWLVLLALALFGASGRTARGGLPEEPTALLRFPRAVRALCIGISSYAQAAISLGYAAADAHALAEALRSSASVPPERVHVAVLTDAAATKAAILAALESLVRATETDDLAVFAFSGNARRGRAAPDEQGFALLAHDARPSDSAALDGMIGEQELKVWLSRISARQQIIVLDCDAIRDAEYARLAEGLRRPDAFSDLLGQRRLLVTTRGTSFESAKVKQGVLTWSLIQCLTGKASPALAARGVISAFDVEALLPGLYREQGVGLIGEPGLFRDSRAGALVVGGDFPITRVAAPAGTPTGPGGAPKGMPLPPAPEPAPAPVQPARRDRALLIATEVYDNPAWSRLENPVLDARAVKSELEDRYGFATELLVNPTHADVRAKYLEWKAATYGSDDQVLLFVSGHGAYDEEAGREGYVILKDAGGAPAYPSALANSRLAMMAEDLPCRHVLVVLDTCYGGTFDRRITSPGGGSKAEAGPADPLYERATAAEHIRRLLKYKARLYLTAGGAQQVSDGRPGQHSPFARGLLSALRGGAGRNGILTFSDLKQHLLGEVRNTEPRAGDFLTSEPGAEFVFLTKEARAALEK